MLASPTASSTARSAFAAVAVAPISFFAGLIAMRHVFDAGGTHMDVSDARLYLAAATVTFLSIAACSVAGGAPTPARTAGATFSLSMVAAIACAPATLVSWFAAGWERYPTSPEDAVFIPLLLAFMTVAGLVFSLPFGGAFATVYTAVLASVAAARGRGGHAQRALTRVVLGLGWLGTGALLVPLDEARETWLGTVPPSAALLVLGLAPLAAGLAELVRTRRWLRRIERGEVVGWTIEPALETDTDLPVVLPWGRRGHTLVRAIPFDCQGPFRAADAHERVARLA